MRPLSLSDSQLHIVRAYAKTLPVEWRDRYLSAISDALTPIDTITDVAVLSAVQATLSRMQLEGLCCDD